MYGRTIPTNNASSIICFGDTFKFRCAEGIYFRKIYIKNNKGFLKYGTYLCRGVI
jgi:hypothetical protein